jgi:hypothetical protein
VSKEARERIVMAIVWTIGFLLALGWVVLGTAYGPPAD